MANLQQELFALAEQLLHQEQQQQPCVLPPVAQSYGGIYPMYGGTLPCPPVPPCGWCGGCNDCCNQGCNLGNPVQIATLQGPYGCAPSLLVPGPPGLVGPTGAAYTPAYAYIYNLAGQTVLPGADVIFDTVGSIKGITFTPGGTSATVVASGVYEITLDLNPTTSPDPADGSLQLWINGAFVPTVLKAGGGTGIFPISAGQTIQFHNAASVGSYVFTDFSTPTPYANISFSVNKIDSAQFI